MNFKVNLVLIASVMIVFGAIIIPGNISAETSQNLVTITPINEKLSLEKTIITMNIPQENTLPWGAVRGVVSDHVEGYPAIIQFYKGGEPVHVAQVDVKEDGSYEYKFRARSVDNNTGEITNIFEGQHTIKISIVVHNQNQLI
tara:strand:+ start:35 stop:463 length:429 start_codon:yes stop_codon:yes gene_type:complete